MDPWMRPDRLPYRADTRVMVRGTHNCPNGLGGLVRGVCLARGDAGA